eukprot:1136508-Pelagomonas_calceolata.AAC.2
MEIPQLAAHLTGAAILDGPGGLLLGGTLAHHAYTPPSKRDGKEEGQQGASKGPKSKHLYKSNADGRQAYDVYEGPVAPKFVETALGLLEHSVRVRTH